MIDGILDRIMGTAFCVAGLTVLFEAWRMPRFLEQGASLYEAPGLTPGLLGIALAISGLALALRRRSTGSQASEHSSLNEVFFGSASGARRLLIALAITGIYALVLFGRAPFLLSTILFVFIFTITFGALSRDPPRVSLRATIEAAIIACLVGFGSRYLFRDIFLVPLP